MEFSIAVSGVTIFVVAIIVGFGFELGAMFLRFLAARLGKSW